MHTPTATPGDHLRHITTHYPALRAQLTTHGPDTWPPRESKTFVDDAEDPDDLAAQLAIADDAAAERAERTPDALGERPVPIRLAVLDTIRDLDETLIGCADVIAAAVQRPVTGMPRGDLAGWTMANVDYRARLARQDRTDPRRWHYGAGTCPDAATAATWLLTRIEGRPGPCRPLTDREARYIGHAAVAARARLDRALGIAAREDPGHRPCPVRQAAEGPSRRGKPRPTVPCDGGLVLTQPIDGDPWAWCDGPCGGVWRGPELASLYADMQRRTQAA